MSRVKKILEGVARSGRVAGAYLFVGPPGVGKREAAEGFAASLGCKNQDRIVVGPSGTSLKIGQVRELQGFVRYGPSASRYLLVTVERADTLTDQAAAAFLKTLEEPAPGVVFVLLAEREDRIPTTILSRCQRIVFAEKAKKWEPNPEFGSFCDELKSLGGKGRLEWLKFSATLQKEKERIEDLLYDLSYSVRRDARRARIILDTLRFIKRKANLRLSLDVMCLRLGSNDA
jgi:DNA polymerase III delta prime subunit